MHLCVEFSKTAMLIALCTGVVIETTVKRISFIDSPKQKCTLNAVVQVSSDQFCSSVFIPYALTVLGIRKF